MVGNIVGGANEIIECENRRAITRMNKKRGDREILVPVTLP